MKKGEYNKVISNNNRPQGTAESALYYLLKGKSEFAVGDLESAISNFDQANILEPGKASFDLAKCYKIKGDKSLLYENLKEHLLSDFKLPMKDIMLDPVFSDLDKDRDWIRFWSDDWYSEIEGLQSEAEYRLTKMDTDEEFWSNLISNSNDEALLLSLQGQYYHLINENRKASQSFEKALELRPDSDIVNLKYADYLIEINKYDRAASLYNNLIQRKPYEIKYRLLQVRAIIASGQSAKGLELIENLESMGIDSSDLNVLIANELVKEDPEKAIEFLDPVISENPSKTAFNLRAQSLVNIGNPSEAIKDYAMSLDIDPRQPEVYYKRAKLRMAIGDNEGACYDWQKALNLGHRNAADMLYKYCK